MANQNEKGDYKQEQIKQLFTKELTSSDEDLRKLLTMLNLILRPEQLIVFNLLLNSPSKITFIELGTNFGKSKAIIGPLADKVR